MLLIKLLVWDWNIICVLFELMEGKSEVWLFWMSLLEIDICVVVFCSRLCRKIFGLWLLLFGVIFVVVEENIINCLLLLILSENLKLLFGLLLFFIEVISVCFVIVLWIKILVLLLLLFGIRLLEEELKSI